MPDTWTGHLRLSLVTVPVRAYAAHPAEAGDATESDRAIQIRTFVAPDAIDPVYHSGQTYYLAPDEPAGAKSYALLQGGMVRLHLHALAQMVLRGKEQFVLLRPVGHVITMTTLCDASEVVWPSAGGPEVTTEEPSPAEIKLVDALLRARTAKAVAYDQFKDTYPDPPQEEHLQVFNLMDALRKSVAAAQAEAGEKAAKKMAKSVGKAPVKRKKSS